MKYGILMLMTSFVVFSTNAYGQGDDTHNEKPEKVSSAMMQEKTSDSSHAESGQEGDTQAAQDTVMERDFDTIRAAVQSSTTFIVIKALALAVAIIGIGVVYLPRRRMGNS